MTALRHALSFLLLAVGGTAPNPEQEAAKLSGVWRGYVVEGKGERPNDGPVKLEIIIKGKRMYARHDDGRDLGEGEFVLDIGKKPAVLDATRTQNPAKGRTYRGIYALEGDTLRWCVANPNQERPTEFVTRRGQFLLILKRQR